MTIELLLQTSLNQNSEEKEKKSGPNADFLR